jgi:hypothetical protein
LGGSFFYIAGVTPKSTIDVPPSTSLRWPDGAGALTDNGILHRLEALEAKHTEVTISLKNKLTKKMAFHPAPCVFCFSGWHCGPLQNGQCEI